MIEGIRRVDIGHLSKEEWRRLLPGGHPCAARYRFVLVNGMDVQEILTITREWRTFGRGLTALDRRFLSNLGAMMHRVISLTGRRWPVLVELDDELLPTWRGLLERGVVLQVVEEPSWARASIRDSLNELLAGLDQFEQQGVVDRLAAVAREAREPPPSYCKISLF